MTYLLLSILTSSSLMVIFRFFDKYKVNNFRAIVVNYITCFILSIIFLTDKSFLTSAHAWSGFPYTVLLGTMFIFLFGVIAKSVQLAGIAVSTIAQKLSFIFPVIYAFLLLNDSISFVKIMGIMLAIIAVIIISTDKSIRQNKLVIGLPIVVFIGSGIGDILVKYIQENHMTGDMQVAFTLLLFLTAAVIGSIVLIFKRWLPTQKDLVAGIILGIPNYGSIYFLVLALENINWGASSIFFSY